jgi:ELWxxDGT repeat protein
MNLRKSVFICLLGFISSFAAEEIIQIPFQYFTGMTSYKDILHFNAFNDDYYGTHFIMHLDHSFDMLSLGTYGNPGPRNFIEMDDVLYYENNDVTTGDDDADMQLWTSDGTQAGTVKLVDSPMGDIVKMGSTLFFRRFIPSTGFELWSYTKLTGAQMISDINPGPLSSFPDNFVEFNGKMFFFAFTETQGYEIWVTDGTAAGTMLLKDCNPGTGSGQIYNITNYNISGSFHEYKLIQNIYTPIIYKNKLYFFANNGVNGYELWCTDGTTAGTQMVQDINPGSGHSLFPRTDSEVFGDGPQFTILNDDLYFIAYDAVNGFEIRKITNNSGVVELLKDIFPGVTDSRVRKIVAFNGALYFGANDGIYGHELWRSSGTEATTNLLVNICDNPLYTEPEYELQIKNIITHDNMLFFCATVATDFQDCSGGTCVPSYQLNDHLFRSDGTAAGTTELMLISQNTSRRDHFLTSHADGVYFLNFLAPSSFEIVRYYESYPPSFTSTPVTTGGTGTLYRYEISATSMNSGPIWIESIIKPDWATITTNEFTRTAVLEGTPTVPGSYPILISARNAYGESVTQSFTLTVTDNSLIRVSAYMLDEGINESNISKPRIYIKNTGNTTLSDLKMEYYFTTENGKTPVIDDYWTPKSSITLQSLGNSIYKIVYNFTGYTVDPDSALPNKGGNVIGIHYPDWSSLNKSNDYSNNLSRVFAENSRICVYSSTGTLLWGTPLNLNQPPIANAGVDISVTDNGAPGESITLNGTQSNDPDGSIVSYEWIKGGIVIATGSNPTILFQQGIHSVTLKVTDNGGLTATDEVSIIVSAPSGAISFSVSPLNVPANTPITVNWQIPSSMGNVSVRILLQRAWDVLPWSISGTVGSHTQTFWEWSKYFFGGSGPWLMRFEVNGVVVKQETIRFLY